MTSKGVSYSPPAPPSVGRCDENTTRALRLTSPPPTPALRSRDKNIRLFTQLAQCRPSVGVASRPPRASAPRGPARPARKRPRSVSRMKTISAAAAAEVRTLITALIVLELIPHVVRHDDGDVVFVRVLAQERGDARQGARAPR